MIEPYLAEFNIRQLHARYADAVWRQDLEAFGNCFAHDCEWRVAGQVMRGRIEAMTFISGSFPLFRRLFLQFGTPIVDVTDAGVTGRTFVNERSQFSDGTPFAPIGIYHERFVEEADGWRFKWRLFQTAYVGGPELTNPYLPLVDYGAPPQMPPADENTDDPSGVGSTSARALDNDGDLRR